MNAPVVATDVDSYIADVERYLDDLPDEDRRELIEDVREHVTEVAAEDEGTLVDRLGPPERYAAELRASAGLPSYVPREQLSATDRLRRRLERSPLAALTNSAPVRYVRGFAPELRPAWWVVRGYLAAVVIDRIFFTPNVVTGGLPTPRLGDSLLLGVALIAVCVGVSILAGRAAARKQRWLGLAVAVNIAIVALFVGALPGEAEVPTASVRMVDAEPFGFLQHEDGAPITHICAYDEDGKRMKNVQLYDQHGRPIAGSAGERLDLLKRKLEVQREVRPFIEEKMLRADEGAEEFECPKNLKDLQSQADPYADGIPRVKRVQSEPPLPIGPRGFIVE